MKIEKFVSISILHAFLLLLLAAMIASCQKKSIHEAGYFSTYESNTPARFPASIATGAPKISAFDHKQDSKQIYIYCSQSSLKIKQCYEHHFNQILSSFISKYGPLDAEKLLSIKESNKFEEVEAQVGKIQSDILNNLEPKLSTLVSKREEFCNINSKINPDRCMSQYLERDSLAVLNAYQYENKRLNGHEYIYLKNIIQQNLKAKLDTSSEKLKEKLKL